MRWHLGLLCFEPSEVPDDDWRALASRHVSPRNDSKRGNVWPDIGLRVRHFDNNTYFWQIESLLGSVSRYNTLWPTFDWMR